MARENSNNNEQLDETVVQGPIGTDREKETVFLPNGGAPLAETGVLGNETLVASRPFDASAFANPEYENSLFIRTEVGSSDAQIARVCLFFENNWTTDRTFSIQDALRRLPPRLRSDGLKELVKRDIALGAAYGSSIPVAKYKAKFPSCVREIDDAYAVAMTNKETRRLARVGRKLGDLRLEKIIGKGGMGVVYKAYNETMRRYEAVKYIAPVFSDDKRNDDFIRIELVTNGQVNDPRFACAFNSGNDGDFSYLVMEYVDGVDLVRYLRNERGAREKSGPLSLVEAASVVCEVAKGLRSIHDLGIIHRDIKPENIMIDEEGQIRILDLGLAKWRETESPIGRDSQSAEEDGAIVGTPAYMSPEGYSHPELVDEQSDLYCLGGVFFFLATGQLPIMRYNPRGNEPPLPLSSFFSKSEEAPSTVNKSTKTLNLGRAPLPFARNSQEYRLLNVIEKLLEPDRAKRYKKAQDVVDDIEEILGASRVSERIRQAKRRERTSYAVAAVFVVALAATVATLLSSTRNSRPASPTTSSPPTPVVAEDPPREEIADVKFLASLLADGGAVITGIDGEFKGGKVVVPEKIVVVNDAGEETEEPVVRIEEDVFAQNQKLESIALPNGIIEIVGGAFRNCRSLKSIVLSENLEAIGSEAFCNCQALASIKLPDSTSVIGDGAFTFCDSLSRIEIGKNSANFSSVDGVLFSKDGKKLVLYPAGKEDERYVTPIGVEEIGAGAFRSCVNLKSVTLREGLTRIGDDAFENCESLSQVSLPQSLLSIGENAFPESTEIIKRALFEVARCEGGAEILRLAGEVPDGELIVPSTVFVKNDADEEAEAPVVRIGARAFAYNRSIKSITLPEGMTRICGEAFLNCESLTSIRLPESLTQIDAGAFSNCVSLSSIRLPKDLKQIGFDAFWNCKSLESIALPEGLAQIGGSAFNYCSALKKFEVAVNNANFREIDGVLFSKDGETLLAYPRGKGDKYIVPAGVKKIGDRAFKGCETLTSISLPEGITTIGSGAFWNCRSLSSINLPNSLRTIEYFAFLYCVSLKSVTLPSGLLEFEGRVFPWCSSLTKIDVDENNPNYSSIDGVVFTKDGERLVAYPAGKDEQEYFVPRGTVVIGDNAFDGVQPLSSVVISDSVKEIGVMAFNKCRSLSSITLPQGLKTIGNEAFYECQSLSSIFLPEGLKTIGDGAFNECRLLSSITLPKSVESVGKNAFPPSTKTVSTYSILGRSCEGGAEITRIEGQCYGELVVPKTLAVYKYYVGKNVESSVLRIGEQAFADRRGITSITLPEGVTWIGGKAFSNCESLTSINIPKGVTQIHFDAFWNCKSLKSIALPETATEIEYGAFAYCQSLSKIEVDENNPNYRSIDGVLFSKDGKKLIAYPVGKEDEEYVVPQGVEEIGDNAFRGCRRLKSIALPNDLKTIGFAPFFDCVSLTSITLPEGLTYLGGAAFRGCQSLTTIALPNELTRLEDETFMDCVSLKTIELPNDLTQISANAFNGCIALKNISLPTGLTTIGDGTFWNCQSLESLYLPATVTQVGVNVFINCASLPEIETDGANANYRSDDGVLFSKDGKKLVAFPTGKKVNGYAVPDGVEELEICAFRACWDLESITLPESLVRIGHGAFYHCTSLKTINIPEGITQIEDSAFYGCGSLKFVGLPGGLTKIGAWAFRNCGKLRSITLPRGLKHIGSCAFFDCKSLESVVLPKSVESIGDEAFPNSTKIERDKE